MTTETTTETTQTTEAKNPTAPTEPTETSPSVTTDDVIKDSPLNATVESDAVAPKAEQTESVAHKPATSTTEWKFGEKSFQSREEMVAHLQSEGLVAAQEEAQTVTPQTPLDPIEKDPLTEFLTDPEEYEQKLVDKAVAKIAAADQTKAEQQKRWDQFFDNNKDLAASRNLVQLVADKVELEAKRAGKPMGWEEGAKVVADRARKLAEEIRGNSGEEVNTSSQATVVSSSGNPAPVRVTEPVKKMTFTDQMRHWKAKKGRTKTQQVS